MKKTNGWRQCVFTMIAGVVMATAIGLAAVLCMVCVIGCSRQGSTRQTGFRPSPAQTSESTDKKSWTEKSDASENRLAKMEKWLKKADYQLLYMTFAGPIMTSKVDSREVSETADFWLCIKSPSLVKAIQTTSAADDGKFIELQFPLAVKDDALKLAQHLDSALFEAITKLLANSEGTGAPTLAGGYSVSFSTNCVTSPDKRALVIRSVEGPHHFDAEAYNTPRGMIMMQYKVSETEPKAK